MQKLLLKPMQVESPAAVRRSRGVAYLVGGAAILVVLTLATHGLALFDGKVLDDFAHQKGLHEHGGVGCVDEEGWGKLPDYPQQFIPLRAR
jgi:hypothetical protein